MLITNENYKGDFFARKRNPNTSNAIITNIIITRNSNPKLSNKFVESYPIYLKFSETWELLLEDDPVIDFRNDFGIIFKFDSCIIF